MPVLRAGQSAMDRDVRGVSTEKRDGGTLVYRPVSLSCTVETMLGRGLLRTPAPPKFPFDVGRPLQCQYHAVFARPLACPCPAHGRSTERSFRDGGRFLEDAGLPATPRLVRRPVASIGWCSLACRSSSLPCYAGGRFAGLGADACLTSRARRRRAGCVRQEMSRGPRRARTEHGGKVFLAARATWSCAVAVVPNGGVFDATFAFAKAAGGRRRRLWEMLGILRGGAEGVHHGGIVVGSRAGVGG